MVATVTLTALWHLGPSLKGQPDRINCFVLHLSASQPLSLFDPHFVKSQSPLLLHANLSSVKKKKQKKLAVQEEQQQKKLL